MVNNTLCFQLHFEGSRPLNSLDSESETENFTRATTNPGSGL